jgi:hypothetical protein
MVEENNRFSFKGWNLKEYLKGRKKLLVAIVGYVGGYIVTQNPTMSAIVAAGTELVYALFDYWVSK